LYALTLNYICRGVRCWMLQFNIYNMDLEVSTHTELEQLIGTGMLLNDNLLLLWDEYHSKESRTQKEWKILARKVNNLKRAEVLQIKVNALLA